MSKYFYLSALLGIMLVVNVVIILTPAAAQDVDSNKQELISLVHDQNYDYWRPLIVKKLIHFRLSSAWWEKMLDKNRMGITKTANLAYNINEYGKRMGWGDISQIEWRNLGPKEEAKPKVEQMVDGWRDKVSFTMVADSTTCDTNAFEVGTGYLSYLSDFLYSSGWKPTSGVANITLIVSPTAKDISVTISKDGKNFTIAAPANMGPPQWDSKIAHGMKRGAPQI